MRAKLSFLFSLLPFFPACVTTSGGEATAPAEANQPAAARKEPTTTPATSSGTNAANPQTAKAASTEGKNPDAAPDDELNAIKSDSLYVDPKQALGSGKDDFNDIDQRAAAYQKDASTESEDARVERELRELKEADAKAQAEEEKREAEARNEALKRAQENAASDQSEAQEELREAQKKAQATPGIDKNEMQWRGLED